jgi:hypothetical protein
VGSYAVDRVVRAPLEVECPALVLPAPPALVHRGVIRRLSGVEAVAARTNGTVIWALKPKRDYYKEARVVGDVDAEAATVEVEFVYGGERAQVALADLERHDSPNLEDYTAWDNAVGMTKRLTRKGVSGTAWGDVSNTLGAMSATAGFKALEDTAHKTGFLATGIIGGSGVFLGGASQIVRAAVLTDKSTSDRLSPGSVLCRARCGWVSRRST